MKCAYCQEQENESIKEHRVYELEWDQEGYPVFYEFSIGLCEEHQRYLEEFTKKQKFMNLIQIIALLILGLSIVGLLLLENYLGAGVISFIFIGLFWFRKRPNQRRLSTEEDCVAFGYQTIVNQSESEKEPVLYFSKKEKERIFKV